MNLAPTAEMLVNRQHCTPIRGIAPAKHWKHLVAVTLLRWEYAAGCSQLINDWNHQPVLDYLWLLNLRSGLLTSGSNLAQLSGADIEEMNRAVGKLKKQISRSREKPNRGFWR